MKYLILLILFISTARLQAQINLVPNPSFEDTVYCPFGLDQMNAATGWSSFRNSPDYFNGCNNFNGIGTPNTSFGFQYPHSGQAYIGLITYRKYNSSSGYNYREFAGAALNMPLQLGAKYYFSFYVVAAERISGYLSNNIGLRFFTLSFSNLNPAPIDNFSHFKVDTILTDSLNWYKFSGSFIADSNYSHVCIGNFYDYLSTDTISFNSLPDYAYYFVDDDICVTTDSLYNETWTGLPDIEQNEIQHLAKSNARLFSV
jgi:hypothetical protein